jgi:RNA polymerase sigma-70 factor, ECF subfamily
MRPAPRSRSKRHPGKYFGRLLPPKSNMSQMGMISPVIKSSGHPPSSLDSARLDEELLAQIRQGDRFALIEVYDRYQAPVYQFVFAMSGGDQSIAADITQDVFLLMIERTGPLGGAFSRFNPEKGVLEGYLLGVARRLTRKVMRKQSRWLPIGEEIGSKEAFAEKVESNFSLERLRVAIGLLPVKYREAIVLCCLQERSYEQAATIIGCSTGTVASRLSRARKLLSERLDARQRGSSTQSLGRDRLGQILRRGRRP